MPSRAKYYMRQFGLVGEQMMSSPLDTSKIFKTQSVGYNLHLNEEKNLPVEKEEEVEIIKEEPSER